MVSLLILALAADAPAVAPPAAPAPIFLVCAGTTSKDQSVGDIAALLSGSSTSQRVDLGDIVRFQINGDNTGKASVPKRIQSGYKENYKEGWFPLSSVATGPNEFSGSIRMHSMYKPKFRIDRVTGLVTIRGNLGDFSGKCEPYDPAGSTRRF